MNEEIKRITNILEAHQQQISSLTEAVESLARALGKVVILIEKMEKEREHNQP